MNLFMNFYTLIVEKKKVHISTEDAHWTIKTFAKTPIASGIETQTKKELEKQTKNLEKRLTKTNRKTTKKSLRNM